jgi:hypothetical protein
MIVNRIRRGDDGGCCGVDGMRAYLHAVIDNFSRRILA